ncbi:hypothetical protein BKI52_14995 [marine bacterium AO1-C]|nr:hypothetical protein BKI52_14995 [marine bacterium AO1-C]
MFNFKPILVIVTLVCLASCNHLEEAPTPNDHLSAYQISTQPQPNDALSTGMPSNCKACHFPKLDLPSNSKNHQRNISSILKKHRELNLTPKEQQTLTVFMQSFTNLPKNKPQQ